MKGQGGALPGRRGRAGSGAVLGLLLGVLVVIGLAQLGARLVPLPARLLAPPSSVLRFADGGIAHASLALDERWRLPGDLAGVDPALVDALIALEDRRFWWHPGVDPIAVGRAAAQNVSAGRVVSGGSTLTLQLVRLLEPRPRTLRSKAVEAVRAAQLELVLSKSQILEGWLRYAPYGRNVEGVQAAAWAFFGHGAEALSPAEIALLLAIPQDPTGRSPAAGDEAGLRRARGRVARRLAAAGALPGVGPDHPVDDVLAEIDAAAVPGSLRPLPRGLPHVDRWIRGAPGAPPPGSELQTTLDAGVQRIVERAVQRLQPEAARAGVHQVAVVVVEHATGSIRALVGGFDFWAARSGSQIPAFAAPRSVGSTLKPFVYARAIDDGHILPDTLLEDIPRSYGAYTPVNYDGRFNGVVRAEEALSRSLNLPFVELLRRVGVDRMLHDLRAGGVRSGDPRPGHYGLSLVAGGIELSPLEVAGLYAALAERGISRPLRWQEGPDRPRALMSPGAAWLTVRALRIRDRPDFPDRTALARLPRALHWKTGTSFGNRDAWSAGSGRRYTVVVWLGNLDNRPSPWLVGATAAAPLLFDVLEALDDGLQGQGDPPPPELGPVEVCALSGLPPAPACPTRRPALARLERVPSARCALHVEVEVDLATGERVGPGCRDGRRTERRVAVRWPAAVQRWLDDAWMAGPGWPPLAPACDLDAIGGAPRITSPQAGLELVLLPGLPAEEQEVPLEAEGEGDLDWYVDGRWVARGGPAARAWWTPTPGAHELRVEDGAGRSAALQLRVRGGEGR